MVEIKIKTDQGEQTIECKCPKARQVNKGFNLYMGLSKAKDEKRLDAVNDYFAFMDKLAVELTGMKAEELDELEIDEKNKIIEYLQSKVKGKIAFLKPSLKSEVSEQKGKKDRI